MKPAIPMTGGCYAVLDGKHYAFRTWEQLNLFVAGINWQMDAHTLETGVLLIAKED